MTLMMMIMIGIYHGHLPSSASIWGAEANSMLSFATCWSFSWSRRPSYVLSTWDVVIIFSICKNIYQRHLLKFGFKVTLPQILHSYVLRSPMVVWVGWPENSNLSDHMQICKYQSGWQFAKLKFCLIKNMNLVHDLCLAIVVVHISQNLDSASSRASAGPGWRKNSFKKFL